MNHNARALHGRDHTVNSPDDTTHYKSPDPKNVGFLERIGLRPMKVVTENIGGVDVELTYHSRAGGRSVVEVTGGPPQLLGFTSTANNGSNWAAEGRSQIEKQISKLNEPMKYLTPEQFHTVTEGKYRDPKIKVPDSITPPPDDFKSLQDQPRKEQAASDHLKDKLRENRHELANTNNERADAAWELQELNKNPKKAPPADIDKAKTEAKDKIENLDKRAQELESKIAADQQKKDDIDQKRKKKEQPKDPKKDSQNKSNDKAKGLGEKIHDAFSEGALKELNAQLELANLIQTTGDALGSNLVYGGIKLYSLSQEKQLDETDVATVVKETIEDTVTNTATNIAVPVVWEGVREAAKVVLPEGYGEMVPPLAVVSAVYQLGDAAYHSENVEEAVVNVACKAGDIALRNTCQYVSANAGMAVGVALSGVLGPVVGPLIGATIGGAMGTGAYLGTKYSVKNFVMPRITSNTQVLKE